MKKILFLIISIAHFSLMPLPQEAREKGFVYLHEIDPTIIISPRYCSCENFLGKNVDGYQKPAVVLTRAAAEALKRVQEAVKKDGYCLVVYDGYRPQCASNHFVRWADVVEDQQKKSHYYPRVDKSRVFELGYVAKKSGHSRGSTVDLTLIKIGDELHDVVCQERTFKDGFKITFLDDGTVDMGSSFDLFDVASHYENDVILDCYKSLRTYLRTAMEKEGFVGMAEEWWHFTLKNEPYPKQLEASYFNFVVS